MSRALGIVQTLLLAAFAAVTFFDPSPRIVGGGPVFGLLGDVVALCGVALILVAIRTMGKAVRVDAAPREGAGLVTQGVYSRLRHPIYVGIALVIVGFAMHGITPAAAVIGNVALVYLVFKARYEEKLLAARYPEYAAYRKTTLF